MRRWTRRYRLAVAGALALHALLFAALLLARRAPAPRSMRVDLVRAPRPSAPPAALTPPAVVAPLAPVAPAPAPARPASRTTAASAAPAAAPLARAPAAPALPATGERAAAPAGRERDAGPGKTYHWLAREGVAPGALSLRLDHPDGAPGGSHADEVPGQGLVREKSRAEQLAEEKATVSRKVEGWLSDAKAKDRAQHGRDVYWQSLEDALGRGFDPGWDVLPEGPGDGARSGTAAFMDAWQKAAATYGKAGQPFGNDPDAPGVPRPLQDELGALSNADRGLGSVSLGSGLPPLAVLSGGGGAGAAKLWSHRLSALVRITQREDGSLFGVELLGTSGSPVYDRLVLGQARRLGSLRLGPPKQGRETLWAFETDFTQVPPLPIAGCGLDDFIPRDCFYPLQKRQRSRVRLQAIY